MTPKFPRRGLYLITPDSDDNDALIARVEGVLPFAASDPLRVIPACVIGSASAAALTMFWGVASTIPHGGIFVVPTIGNPMMYLVAILIGAAVGMILLALLKKPLTK